jgi:hypothetical protein
MKNWSAQKKFLFMAVISLAIGSIVTLTLITWSTQTTSSQTPPSDTDPSLCPVTTDKLSKSNSLRFHPIKVVAEPWRGEHNVYAIFAIPLQYRDTGYRSKLLVKGSNTPWDVTPANEHLYGLTTPEGYFLMIGFFRTRLALLYLASGRFGDLKEPCNWTLHLFPR